MDEKMKKEQIVRALESLGMDMHGERFNTEIHHLTTLFDQGQTVADALQTVSDPRLRNQLKPILYAVTLRAFMIALAKLDAITPEQASDLTAFLDESIGVVRKKTPKQGRIGNG